MLVYIPAICLVFLFTFYAEKVKNMYDNSKKKGYLAAFIALVVGVFAVLFLVSGTRYGIGLDYFFTDNSNFNGLRDGVGEGYTEVLTNALAIAIINSGIENPNLYFFGFFAFFTCMAYVIAIYINKDNKYILPTFDLFFYMVFFTSMNQMRQSLGLAFGLLAFAIMYRWKNIWATLFSFAIIVIPILFHYSTILNFVPLIIYLIIRKWNNKFNSRILMTVMCGLIAFAPIAFFVIKYTLPYIPVFNKYTYFFDPNFDNTAPGFVKFLASIAMFIVPLLNFIYCALNFENTDDHMIKMIMVISGFNLFFMVFGVMMNSIIFADRLKTFFYMLEVIFIPYMFEKLPKGNRRMSYLALTCGVMLIWTISTLPTCMLYPYRNIFFPDIIIY